MASFPGQINLGKPIPQKQILMKQEMMGWQWHQLGHMQIITSLQTDNQHLITQCFQAGCFS